MKLGDKIRYLREVQGTLRELGREMTQQEIGRAIQRELKQSISHTHMLLARFFKVYPGYR
jgi:hypothetical protein